MPSPLRCFKCQQFGQHQDNCSKTRVCAKCAQPDHQDTACTSAMKCVNCNGGHTAHSKNCPRLITEKEIQRVCTERKISFPEAWKIVEGVNTQPSFASVVARQVVSVGCQTDAVEIRSATDATNVSATPASSSSQPNTSKGGGGGCHLRVVPPGQLFRRPSTPKPFIEPGFVIFFDVRFFVFAFRWFSTEVVMFIFK